jgi:hypothetical protein
MGKNIRRYCIFLIGIAVAITQAACSGMKIKTDYDPGAVQAMGEYRTYRWLSQPREPDARVYNKLVALRVTGAVEDVLNGKGYGMAEDAPDFLVGWHAAIWGRLDVREVDRYYGYGHRRWRGRYGGTMYRDVQVREYEEGMLILDIVDGKSRELVWRGSAQAEIRSDVGPQKKEERIRRAAEKILEQFPPAR